MMSNGVLRTRGLIDVCRDTYHELLAEAGLNAEPKGAILILIAFRRIMPGLEEIVASG